VQLARHPKSLYGAAAFAGACLANSNVLVPLLALAHHGSASLAGTLLATITIAVALGALLATRPLALLGERTLLRASFAVIATGQIVGVLFGGATPALALAALLVGAGLGLFWVASQAMLARGAGLPGGERGIVRQYVCYVIGSALGAPASGLAGGFLRILGASSIASLHLAFAVGLVCALAGLLVCGSRRGRARIAAAPAPTQPGSPRSRRLAPDAARALRALGHGLSLQAPDLVLVCALSVLATLAPVVLSRELRFSAPTVGLVVGGLAAGKVLGSLLAERAAPSVSRGALVGAMLALAAGCSGVLALQPPAPLFVAMLVLAVLGAAGAWPVVVEAGLGSPSERERRRLTVVWNVREYGAIAASTAAGGLLLQSFPVGVSFAIAAAGLVLGAALAWLVLCPRPAGSRRCRPQAVAGSWSGRSSSA
jgi:MFS family permease